MGEEFYCVIKLVSGEEILSLVMADENDGDPVLILQNPVTIKTVQNNQGHYIKIKPWIELSLDDFFIVRPDKIITMTEINDKKLIEIYNSYILEDTNVELHKTGGVVKPSQKMGYIGSVEDARKKLEKIFKGIKEI
jgi:hypothetical protein